MFSAFSQYKGNSCGQKTASRLGWKLSLPVEIMPWVKDSTPYKERVSLSCLPVVQGEKRFCDTDGNMDEPLGPQYGRASPHPELARQTDKGMNRGHVGEYRATPVACRDGTVSCGSVTPRSLGLASVRLLPAVWGVKQAGGPSCLPWAAGVGVAALSSLPVAFPPPGERCVLHAVPVLVLALLLALLAAVAALSGEGAVAASGQTQSCVCCWQPSCAVPLGCLLHGGPWQQRGEPRAPSFPASWTCVPWSLGRGIL